jgi:uncharacterized protein YqjF (DUF2071 family)
MSFLLAQTWRDLLFAHWPVKTHALRPWIPASLDIDEFDGEAWIAAVPFAMTGIRLKATPPLPYLSRTLELNLRTYVTLGGKSGGKPGVFFFSLDAASPIAVRIARRFFHLPYFDATMTCTERDGTFDYRSARIHRNSASAPFHAFYRASGPVQRAAPGTLDRFLTERYCFYTANPKGDLFRGDIAHDPWPLQPAEADFLVNGLTLPWNIDLPDTKPLLHFSKRLDIRAQPVRRVTAP